ncbi:vWA domain-containing protein, partial [Halochromatium sp.]
MNRVDSGMDMRFRHRALLLTACFGLMLLTGLRADAAQEREALKQPNKTSLYERVLTRPGASLVQQPGAAAGELIDAFSRYYVYGRQEQGERSWLEVGVDAQGEVRGWVDQAQTVPWRQQLAVAFTNPAANRERTLFFADWASLEALMAAEDPGSEIRPLTQRIIEGETDERVVAIEPDRPIDINERFYLLPILGYEEFFSDAGHLMRGLKVASVTKTELPAVTEPSADSSSASRSSSSQAAPTASATPTSATATAETEVRKLMPFRAAVVFVIDSTISMQAYIDEARQAVRKVYERIEGSDLLDRVAFGLVAFRAESADPTRAKQLEYVARLFVDPAEVSSAEDFLGKARQLNEAAVTTDRFDEDPYAGVQLALDEIPWSQFGARYLVLITDAGALEGDASTTGLRAEQVRSAAAAENVAIFVLHLKTPQGAGNHASAETQYRTLSANPAIQESLYLPVETGSSKRFKQQVDALAGAVVGQIERAMISEAEGSAPVAAKPAAATPASDLPAVGSEEDAEAERIRRLVDSLGHAMQLAYLGRKERTAAPQVFEGWISDRDLANPTLRTVDARLLLTDSASRERLIAGAFKSQTDDGTGIVLQAFEAVLKAEPAEHAVRTALKKVPAPVNVDALCKKAVAAGVITEEQAADLKRAQELS